MKKSFAASIWSILDKVWSQLVGFAIGIVLARLLTPENYGLVGISMIFISFSNVFIEAGFSNALIRKLDRSQTDYSTAFHFNAVMGVLMYVVLYISAPFISNYFDDENLTLLVRIVSISIIFNSLCIVQNAILTIDLKMKEQAFINFSAQIPSGLIAIFLAYKGLGVYSLAIQIVLLSVIRTILFWLKAKWRPSFEFSRESMNYLWGFGSKLIGANLLGIFFNEIYSVLIGKYIGKSDLGYYTKGRSLSMQPESVCNGVIQKVALPLLAIHQQDIKLLKHKYKETTQLITCIMTFVSGILICIAHPLILLLWGHKWEAAVPVFQMLVISNVVSYVSYLSLVLLQIVNHTEYTLKLEFLKKPLFFIIIILSLQYELKGLLAAMIVNSFLATLVNISAPSKYIGYSYCEQFRDIIKYMIAWVIGTAITFGVSLLLSPGLFLDIIIRTSIMGVVYMLMLLILKDALFVYYSKNLIHVFIGKLYRL